MYLQFFLCIFFFNDTATTEIYTLSLHDALPIFRQRRCGRQQREAAGPEQYADHPGQDPLRRRRRRSAHVRVPPRARTRAPRSEEHTSELQSRQYLVCRLLLEKKKKKNMTMIYHI